LLNWLWFMIYHIYLWISKWFSSTPECWIPPTKLQTQFSRWRITFEPHLLIQSNMIHLSVHLIHNSIHKSDSPDGGFSPSIKYSNLKFHTLVDRHVCHPMNIHFCSSSYSRKICHKSASGTSCHSPYFLQLLSLIMLQLFIKKVAFNWWYMIDFMMQLLFYPLLISIQPVGCRLSGSNQVHLKWQSFCGNTIFNPVYMNVKENTGMSGPESLNMVIGRIRLNTWIRVLLYVDVSVWFLLKIWTLWQAG